MRGSISELLVIAIVAAVMLLFFGAKKLPELAKSMKESKEILASASAQEGLTTMMTAEEMKAIEHSAGAAQTTDATNTTDTGATVTNAV